MHADLNTSGPLSRLMASEGIKLRRIGPTKIRVAESAPRGMMTVECMAGGAAIGALTREPKWVLVGGMLGGIAGYLIETQG